MIILATERSTYLDVDKIDWEPTRFPGVYIKKLYEDASGKATSLTKMDKGAVLPDHRHVGIEQSYVLQGTLVDDTAPAPRATSSGAGPARCTRPGRRTAASSSGSSRSRTSSCPRSPRARGSGPAAPPRGRG